MEIQFDKSTETEGIIKINVLADDYQSEVDKKVKELSRTAEIKGFRKGKVPTGMIRKMYGKALVVDEINKLVGSKLNNYLRENETHFLGEPIPVENGENIDWATQKDFDFSYKVGFAAPFNVSLTKKVKQEKYLINVDDTVIDETVENLQRRFGNQEEVQEITKDDLVNASIFSKDGDVEKPLSIDLRDVKPATLKKLKGMKVGEEVEIDSKHVFKHDKQLQNNLGMNDEDFKNFKGKNKIVIQKITHSELAEVNQEFFDQCLGKDAVKTEEEFRANLKEKVEESYVTESEQFLQHQLQNKLIEKANIQLPDQFLKEWLLATDNNLTKEQIEQQYEYYTRDLNWSLIKNQIATTAEIKVEHEDVINQAKEIIRNQFFGGQVNTEEAEKHMDSIAENYLKAEEGKNYTQVFNNALQGKVFDYIKEKIEIQEKTVSLEEFRNI